MTNSRQTVGAHQWLIVGALQQSSTGELPLSILYQHMAPWLYPSEVRASVATLVRARMVEVGGCGYLVTLTSRGEGARRSVGKSSVPYFWPLVLPAGVSVE